MNATPERPSGSPLRLTIPAHLARLAEARAWIGEIAGTASLSDARSFDLQVAVSEATANAIEHAASGVELTAYLLPDRLIVEIVNDGVFQPGLYKDDERRRRGLGLPLMVSLADQVHVASLSGSRTKVSLTFFTAAREPSGNGSESAPDVQAAIPARAGMLQSKSSGRSLLLLLLLLPLPLLIILAVVFDVGGIDAVHESAGLLTAFNTLFTSAAGLLVAYLAARTYRVGGSSVQLALGSGAIVLALGSLLAGPMISDPNGAITVYNTAVLVSGALFLAAGFLALRSRSGMQQPASRWKLALAYSAALAFVVVWAILASNTISSGVLPAFYVVGAGSTDVREAVLAVGVLLFVAASVSFALIYRRRLSRFALLASVSFGTFAVALGILALTEAPTGSPINWLARAGIWLSGAYLLAGAMSVDYGRGWLLGIERDLEETRIRYQGMVEVNPDAVWIRSEGRFVYANAAAARLLGYPSVSELIGKDVDEAFHPETRDAQRERVAEVYAGGISPATDEMFLRADGSTVHASVFRTRVEYKGHLGIQAVARDITERKRAEEESEEQQRLLLAAQKDYSLLFSEMLDGLAVHEIILDDRGEPCDYRFLAVNPSFERLTGLYATDIIGKTVLEVIPDLEPSWIERYGRVALTGEEVHFNSYSAALGRHYEVTAYRPKDGRFATIFHDVTERKKAEDALLKLNRTLTALSNSNQALMRAADESAFLEAACWIIVNECGHAMVWIGYKEDDDAKSVRPVASAGFEEGYLETLDITWSEGERGRGPTGVAIRTGKPCVCRNMLTDPSFAPWRERAVERGYASSIALPLTEGGITFGAIAIYSREPDSFLEDEVELLCELADDLATGITSLRLRSLHVEAEKEKERLILELQEASSALATSNKELLTMAEELAARGEELTSQNEELRDAQAETERLLQQQSTLFQTLQETLIDIPKELPRVQFSHLYRSATELAQVGGDFYDVFQTKLGQTGVLIGDVSGHGVEAARIATLAKDTVHAFAHQFRWPHLVLRATNRLLVQKGIPGFVTAFLGFLDPDTGTFVYSCAGHPPPLLSLDGQISLLECVAPPLGVFADARYRDMKATIPGGSRILFYTDGITEARRNGDLFGEERLADTLRRMRDRQVATVPTLLLEEALLFSEGLLLDDVALLVVDYEGTSG